MKWMMVAVLGLMPLAGGAQPLLEFRTDLAFHAGTVDAVAERSYRARLQSLAAAGRLDTDAALLGRRGCPEFCVNGFKVNAASSAHRTR